MSFLNVDTDCKVRFITRSNEIMLAKGTKLTPYGIEIQSTYIPLKHERAVFQIEIEPFKTVMAKSRVEIVKKGSFFIRFLNVWENDQSTRCERDQDFLFCEELKKKSMA